MHEQQGTTPPRTEECLAEQSRVPGHPTRQRLEQPDLHLLSSASLPFTPFIGSTEKQPLRACLLKHPVHLRGNA